MPGALLRRLTPWAREESALSEPIYLSFLTPESKNADLSSCRCDVV